MKTNQILLIELQNEFFTQNDNFLVFNNSYVDCREQLFRTKVALVKARLAKNIRFWEDINAS